MKFLRKKFKLLHIQILLTILMFTLLIVFSYNFINNTVHNQLLNNTENVLHLTKEKIETAINDTRLTLNSLAVTITNMVVCNYSEREIQKYFDDMSIHLFNNLNPYSFNGLFGYFEYTNKPFLIESFTWDREDFKPEERPWYHASLEAGENVVETIIYEDSITNKLILIYSRCIFDKDGNKLGIIGIRKQIDKINDLVLQSSVSKGSYGILLDQHLIIIAHPDRNMIGKHFDSLNIPKIDLLNLIYNVENLQLEIKNYENVDIIIFDTNLNNGWRLGIFTPKGPFYQSSTIILFILSILGLFFSSCLIVVFIRLDNIRNKIEIENKNKSLFIANMSHEMRTPMNVIVGMTSVGEMSDKLEKKNYCFGKIKEASDHLLGIINDILDLSKMAEGKFKLLKHEEFMFENMINKIVNMLQYKIDSKGQKFTVNIDKNIPKILIGDEQKLSQVIINLIGNANKFTETGGEIELNAKLIEDSKEICILEIMVKDNGIGISQQQQSKLFTSYQQATATTAAKYGGTGLGLTISKNIVELMNGDIWIESDLGQGAAFYFTVKIRKGLKENIPITREIPNFKGFKILIVEDFILNKEILTALLQRTGLDLEFVSNGAECLEILQRNKYHLILMDIVMPVMNGIEATKKIRELDIKNINNNSIPIIAMTANVLREDVDSYLSVGMNDHVGKPIELYRLYDKLKIYLK